MNKLTKLILGIIFSSFVSAKVIVAETTYSSQFLEQNPIIMEYIILEMIEKEDIYALELLFPTYQKSLKKNEKLVYLAKAKIMQEKFKNYQNKEAKKALLYLKSITSNYEDTHIIQQYLTTIDKRESWQFSARVNYLYDKNINNTSSDRHIENTGFIKGEGMLPQKAHGFGYGLDIEKNWNLTGSHNLYFANETSGKSYWDNHDYDELNNRTYLGYAYQNSKYRGALKPFYERQWVGNHRYNWANGVRIEYRQPFAEKWQISTAWEFSQPRYFNRQERNGTIKLASATLVYSYSSKGYVYLGTDFIREQVREKQYSNDLKSLRAGWKQTWHHEINTQLNGSISLRQYKDVASLGGILPLGKIRRDKIYQASLTLWKDNWHWYGFTPKIQFRWKRQSSSIPSMFSYSDKYVQMLVEKAF